MVYSRLAVWLDSYQLGANDALATASGQGFRAVHANGLTGALTPAELSESGRRHLARYLRDLGLRIGGLAAEFEGHGLSDPARADERMAKLSELLSMARTLHVPMVTARMSGIGETETTRGRLAREVLTSTADLADRMGVVVAIESPQDPIIDCAKAIGALACPALRLAWDTGRMAPDDEMPAIAAVAGQMWLRDTRGEAGRRAEQVAFGTGDVNFPRVLAVTSEADYRGDLVIRTERRRDAAEFMRHSKGYFERLTRPT